jgi:RimJ/RimL family protein N-acetyltransferase
MIIRKIRSEDVLQLIELLVELVEEKPPVALELEPLIMKGERWTAPFLETKSGLLVIAEDKGKIIGFCYAIVPTYYKPVAYIGNAISKEYRRKNIGSQLFFQIASWASKKKLQYLIADVWHWNTKSSKFFEKLGFEEDERFKDKFRGKEEEKIR